MSALLPADVSVILSLGPELNVEALAVDSTEVVVVNATMPMVLSFDPVKGDAGPPGPPGTPSNVPGPPGAPSNVPGPPGQTGQRGSIWFSGAGPPPTPLSGALPGDFYLDSQTGNYYLLS
jgi:hypothetical protein